MNKYIIITVIVRIPVISKNEFIVINIENYGWWKKNETHHNIFSNFLELYNFFWLSFMVFLKKKPKLILVGPNKKICYINYYSKINKGTF
jgi:hypothetical protein